MRVEPTFVWARPLLLVDTYISVCLHIAGGECHASDREPRRRAILRLVRDEERTAGDIASHFEVTRPAVSQHLSVLKEAGLASQRRNGTKRLYRARPEGLADLKAFVDEFWGSRLEALKREAEREERKRDGKHD